MVHQTNRADFSTRGGHLFAFEDLLVELLLEAFVGQVDAELLEAVLFEAFKAVNIQNANGLLLALLSCACSMMGGICSFLSTKLVLFRSCQNRKQVWCVDM